MGLSTAFATGSDTPPSIEMRLTRPSEAQNATERPSGESAREDPRRERAAEMLASYLEVVGRGLLVETEESIDEETVEQLRSLGYLR